DNVRHNQRTVSKQSRTGTGDPHKIQPLFFVKRPAHHRDLHSFPTRRSSDLRTDAQTHGRTDAQTHRETRCHHAAWNAARCVCARSEEHTSELQSPCNLVCRLLLEKKNSTT